MLCFHCHLYFLKESTVWTSPLSCSVGDYKSKLQLYRERRGHPSNPPLPPHPSLTPHLSLPLRLSRPCILILLRFHLLFPLASSVYCTNASCHWWAHLGLACDLPFLVSVCKDRANALPEALRKKKKSTQHLSSIDTGNMCLHMALVAEVCKFHTDKCVWSSPNWRGLRVSFHD